MCGAAVGSPPRGLVITTDAPCTLLHTPHPTQVFYDPWRPRDDRLGPLVLQAKHRSKGYVTIEAIRGQLPQFTLAQIRSAALASRQLRLSADQTSVRRVFGSRDDILQYLDHIFGKKKCVPAPAVPPTHGRRLAVNRRGDARSHRMLVPALAGTLAAGFTSMRTKEAGC